MTQEIPWELVGQGPVVHVAPHSDDAALSSAGLLHACGARGIAVTIITCFSLSPYSRGPTNGELERNTAVRKAEDERFCATLPGPVTLRWLDLPDAPLRPAHAGEHPCKTGPRLPEDDELVERIARTLLSDIDPAAWLLFPLGLGRHIDHVLTRDAGAKVARGGRARLAFWEDLPYAGRRAPEVVEKEIDAAMEATGLKLRPVLLLDPDLEQKKLRAMECYPSQIIDVHVQGALTQARRVAGTGMPAERLWLHST